MRFCGIIIVNVLLVLYLSFGVILVWTIYGHMVVYSLLFFDCKLLLMCIMEGLQCRYQISIT